MRITNIVKLYTKKNVRSEEKTNIRKHEILLNEALKL